RSSWVDSLSALIEAACAVLRCKLATDSTYDALSWVGPVEDPRRSGSASRWCTGVAPDSGALVKLPADPLHYSYQARLFTPHRNTCVRVPPLRMSLRLLIQAGAYIDWQHTMHRGALFLDRDGVINIDRGYIHRPDQFEFVPGIFELARFWTNELRRLIVVVTNQSGIGRGYFDECAYEDLTRWMCD